MTLIFPFIRFDPNQSTASPNFPCMIHSLKIPPNQFQSTTTVQQEQVPGGLQATRKQNMRALPIQVLATVMVLAAPAAPPDAHSEH